MDAAFYTPSPLTPDEADEHDRVYGALAEATRRFADAQLRTQVDHAEAEAVTAELEALTARLLAKAMDGAHGVELGPREGEVRHHGNTVTGLRNPFSVVRPEHQSVTEDGHLVYRLELGAGHEGPPGLVHGGVTAMILDQLLGDAAAAAGTPGMTGRLTVHYRRPTPLGELAFEAWTERVEGRKSFVRGQVTGPDGTVTVEAEALFILPRWASEHPEFVTRRLSFE
jgi:acyl-coenzyme A thioesterase PaaI-like protein